MKNVKKREESKELLIMSSLNKRMKLSKEEKTYYLNLVKGYIGECSFDTLTEKLTADCLTVNDLRIKVSGRICQLDTVLILPHEVHVYEIKNFEGEYIYKNGELYILPSQKEIFNPFEQLNRSRKAIAYLMDEWNIQKPLRYYLTFVNPNFTLYNVSPRSDLLLPTNLNSHFKKVNDFPFPLIAEDKKFAEKLCGRHITDYPILDLPKYTYESLRKGIICLNCRRFAQAVTIERKKWCCTRCKKENEVNETILFHIQEYCILFPKRDLTTEAIFEWCGGAFSMHRIRAVLKEHFQVSSGSRWMHFL